MRVAIATLAAVGATLGYASLLVMLQDSGSCPEGAVSCDHAYYINGALIWMRPLYTELGAASAILLTSALTFGIFLTGWHREHGGWGHGKSATNS